MPTFLIKPVRETDFYFLFSTVSDRPVGWGTREELADELNDDARFERTDTTGTSMFGGWYSYNDNAEFLIRNMGRDNFIVKRSDMQAFCLSCDPNDPTVFDRTLTTPVPDVEEALA